MNDKLLAILKRYWGYDSFRPMQVEIITSVLAGRDTLALMPTGGGKSLLYQVPTMACDGLCIVVTPLISLMKDQVDRLKRIGIQAVAVHSGMTLRQIDIALDNCVYGDVKFLYLAPERLAAETFRIRVGKMNVSLLAVDEAHCISQWGYDFRPSYLRIAEIRKLIPDTPILALTASATPAVAKDICERLEFGRDGVQMRTSFARANLSFSVRDSEDRDGQLLRVINNVPGSGIVYVRTRETTETVARLLQENGIAAEAYNGGMTHIMRSMRQDAWMKGECRVMVATNAFGMGIDKADVRFVVHYDICDSLEAYYQEAGRAGRDGGRSYAVLLTSHEDKSRALKRFDIEFPPIDKIKEIYEAVCNYLQIGIGEGRHASFTFGMFDFTRRYKLFAATVKNTIGVLQQNGYMTLTDETDNPPRMMFTVARDDLYKIRIEREELDHILRVVLRLYNGLFNDFVAIDEEEIAQAAGYKSDKVHELLRKLWQIRVIRYIPGNVSPMIIMNEERLPTADLYISPESYRLRKEAASERMAAMFRYADNSDTCRSRVIQDYFGDTGTEECGICDICIARRKREKQYPDISGNIMVRLEQGAMDMKKLVDRFDIPSEDVLRAINNLIEEGKIYVDSDGKVTINR